MHTDIGASGNVFYLFFGKSNIRGVETLWFDRVQIISEMTGLMWHSAGEVAKFTRGICRAVLRSGWFPIFRYVETTQLFKKLIFLVYISCYLLKFIDC